MDPDGQLGYAQAEYRDDDEDDEGNISRSASVPDGVNPSWVDPALDEGDVDGDVDGVEPRLDVYDILTSNIISLRS